MSLEVVTKEDLQFFRLQLLDEIRQILSANLATEVKREWLRSKEVRKLLPVSPATLQNLRVAGKLHPKKIGGTWFYSLSELNKLFDEE